MKPSKVLEVIQTYRKLLEERGVGKINYPHESQLSGWYRALEHCHGMLDQMVVFVHEGRMDKVFRWLGFVQGVLWVNGIFTLEELKTHNRPTQTEE